MVAPDGETGSVEGMSVSRMVYLRCDLCLNITQGGNYDMRDSAAEARAVGRKYGWTRRKPTDDELEEIGYLRHGSEYIDVCPECSTSLPVS